MPEDTQKTVSCNVLNKSTCYTGKPTGLHSYRHHGINGIISHRNTAKEAKCGAGDSVGFTVTVEKHICRSKCAVDCNRFVQVKNAELNHKVPLPATAALCYSG